MSPSICIDFGASFTKIAFREAPDKPSQLLTHESLNLDPEHVCIPTVAAWREFDDRWVFGVDAADLKIGDGIRVFSNWKPLLFQSGPEHRVVEEEEIEDETWKRGGIDGSEKPHELAQKLTERYLRWLKRDLVPQMLGRNLPEETTCRVAVPEFAMYTPQSTDLERIVTKAGWFSPGIICISEPVSNLIGSLSQGRNRVVKESGGKLLPAVREMFAESEFLKFIEDELDENREGDQHTILVVDVGNYTTDFGLINIDLEERGFFPLTETFSMEMGVSKLEQWVRKILPAGTREAYGELTMRERELLRTRVFGQAKAWQLPDGTVIGADEQGVEIQNTIRLIADEIIKGIIEFLKLNGITTVGEVILTGGGNNIPALVNRFTELFARIGIPAIHAPQLSETPTKVRQIQLNQQIVRGASALGGSSVLFESL